jgi:hypothetical protein
MDVLASPAFAVGLVGVVVVSLLALACYGARGRYAEAPPVT